MERFSSALSIFYSVAEAQIDWNKFVGFLTDRETTYAWEHDLGFRWISPGETFRDLGIDMRLGLSNGHRYDTGPAGLIQLSPPSRENLFTRAQISFLMQGVIVVKDVLLVVTWYVASCWCFSRRCIFKLRKLVPNLLWMSFNGSRDTRACVAWPTLILPCEGGLGF